MKYRRINFYAGAAAGKSGTAAWLFSQLKSRGIRCAQVKELVEEWAWEGKLPKSFDQVFLFASQLHREDTLLSNGADVVVCDSPLLLSCCYGKMFLTPGWEEMVNIARLFEEQFPAIHIMLRRGKWEIDPAGRFVSSEGVHADAAANDRVVEEFVCGNLGNRQLYTIDTVDREECLKLVLEKLGISA